MSRNEKFLSYLLSSTGLCDGQRDTKDGIGAELALVGGTVKAIEESIDLGLVLDVDVLLDQSRANDGVDVLDGLGDTFPGPLGFVAITEFNGFVLA